jgi:FtsP/CotA-like multicopper oxidase with cupredoxin domain
VAALPAAGADAVELVAAPRSRTILPAPAGATPCWAYADDMPILRVRQGEPFRATLVNRLPEHTSIHWHGIRLPNPMDGVPWLTQRPAMPGESFDYAFAPPDAGSFFFHPHCNSVEQLGRGLFGVLIVDEAQPPAFDADIVCAARDWNIDPSGHFLPLGTSAGAAKAGTFGDVHTVSGELAPVFEVPTGGWARLRVMNLDMSRIMAISVMEAEAWVVATDGNPVEPFPLADWMLGPAMRIDIAVKVPDTTGAEFRLVNNFSADLWVMARARATGAALRGVSAEPPRLPPGQVPEPGLATASRLRLDFSAAIGQPGPPIDPNERDAIRALLPPGAALADSLCLVEQTFWAINKTPWPGQDEMHTPPPLFRLDRGRSYVLELVNATPQMHPIHIHGHSFRVLGSSKDDVRPHVADTALVRPKERLWVAFVADNPGDWMLHCHIVEHQETGMMGYFRVS